MPRPRSSANRTPAVASLRRIPDASPARGVDGKPIKSFARKSAWAAWLEKSHDQSSGVWVRIAKKGMGKTSIAAPEALDVALCYGWIDGQARSDGDEFWLQKYTPRGKRSIWSKRNCVKVIALIASEEMRPAGLAEIERAKQDGRWERAYDSQSTMTVPPDLTAALKKSARARQFFETLDSRNRYAVLFRIHGAKKADTRARRIAQFVAMLARKEKVYG